MTFEWLEGTRVFLDNLVPNSIKTFSSVHNLLTERLSTSPLTNAGPCSIFVLLRLSNILNPLIELPCISQQFDHKKYRHLLLDQLPCVEPIEWWILTSWSNEGPWIFSLQCRSIFSVSSEYSSNCLLITVSILVSPLQRVSPKLFLLLLLGSALPLWRTFQPLS